MTGDVEGGTCKQRRARYSVHLRARELPSSDGVPVPRRETGTAQSLKQRSGPKSREAAELQGGDGWSLRNKSEAL